MQNRALEDLESHLEKAVLEAILFIAQEQSVHPVQEEQHMSVSISAKDKTWTVHSFKRLNLFNWTEFDRLYELEEVRIVISLLVNEHYLDFILKLRSHVVPETSEKYDPVNDAKFIFKQFLVTFSCIKGINFDKKTFQRLFLEWQLYITGKDRGKHLIVLNNFELIDVDEIVFDNYLIRRLTEDEILSLLLVDGYNRENIGNHFGNLRDGLSGKYSPEYCVEFLGAEGKEDEADPLESYYEDEYRKLMVCTLLTLFKDPKLSVGTSLFTSSDFVSHMMEFSGAETSLSSMVYQIEPKYEISKSEVKSFLNLSDEFFKLNYRNWGAFWVASRRLGYSQGRTEIEDKIIDLIVALEAILGARNKQEITYKISLRSAHFIGETPDERSEIFDIISLAYDVRSKIVHGTDDPMDTKKAIKQRYSIDNIYVLYERLLGYVKRIMRELIHSFSGIEKPAESLAMAHQSLLQRLDNSIISKH